MSMGQFSAKFGLYRAILTLLLGAMVVATSGPVGAVQQYHDSQGRFQLVIGDGWMAQPQPGDGIEAAWTSADGGTLFAILRSNITDGSNSTDVMNLARQDNIQTLSDYTENVYQSLRIQNQNQPFLDLTYTGNDGQTWRAQEIAVANRTDGWLLLLNTPASGAVKYVGAFQGMAQTFLSSTPKTASADGPQNGSDSPSLPYGHYTCYFHGDLQLLPGNIYLLTDIPRITGGYRYDPGTGAFVFTSGPWADATYGYNGQFDGTRLYLHPKISATPSSCALGAG